MEATFSLLIFALFGCSENYRQEDLAGTWQIIEIKSEENEVSPSFLGAETLELGDDGTYTFPESINERGVWTIVGERLRLHTESVKDLKGSIIYQGHDSEWRIEKSQDFMIWRGTRKFHNQNLRVLFERKHSNKTEPS